MKLFLTSTLFFALVAASHAVKTDWTGDAMMSPAEHALWMNRAEELLSQTSGLLRRRRLPSKGGAETSTRRGGCGRIISKNEGSMIQVTNGEAISFMDDGDDDRVFCTDTLCAGDGEAMVLYNAECNDEGTTSTLKFVVAYEDVDYGNDEIRFYCPDWTNIAALSCSGVAGTLIEESGPVAEVSVSSPEGTSNCVLICSANIQTNNSSVQ